MRLIDADALILEINNRIRAAYDWCDDSPSNEIKARAEQAIATFCEVSLTVKKMPTIELEQNKGKWEDVQFRTVPHDRISKAKKCSICGKRKDKYISWNFCPNCGADMRGN